MNRRIPLIIVLATATAGSLTMAILSHSASAQQTPTAPVDAVKLARTTAERVVAGRPQLLRASKWDAYQQQQVVSYHNLNYVPYTRSYKGVPVAGGDFVVQTTAAGEAIYTSVAQSAEIGDLSTSPRLTAGQATRIAKAQLKTVTGVEETTLVVDALASPARLAWSATVNGTGARGLSRLTVLVDALTGDVLKKTEHVTEATASGQGAIYGAVQFETTQRGQRFSMRDPQVPTLVCQDAANNRTFTSRNNQFGNGDGTNRETGCVDAFFMAQQQIAMLAQWLNRNGQDGRGGSFPLRVGLQDENAFFDGTQVQIGFNVKGEFLGSADVVGHELGHSVDATTPGGISGGNTSEFVADTFGASTEAFINSPLDPPDFTVGEEVNLLGTGAIRDMRNPAALGSDNCFSDQTAREEVHDAAGPGNHWFFLVSQGTGGNGQGASPTCNNSTVTGLGIENAMKIMYGAMLLKNSNSSYPQYRVLTLQSAKTLFPGSCTQFDTVKAAWDAVAVPPQNGEPTCNG
ncbi:M4 family metallopeptidase [Actinoplanes sp. KI2]|uniref:M4 family metallopeptidase n=1 Tax=Actinoplanes sp. KI2 TaxID=2983315 RepID=UPI0021D60353|nr:M4 family metallopeptidase [Actinoplanes sp. KI2]MCU7727830.1 M4 family metallopeptidase [Actinoplanes sp. KI2]